MHFLPTLPKFISLDLAESEIQDGWIAQFRGFGYVSRVIAAASGGVHSHSALLGRTDRGVEAIEVRELIGGRTIRLRDYFLQTKAKCAIDIFSINTKRFPEFNGEGAVERSRDFVRRAKYNYKQIVRLLCRRTPIIWRLGANTTDDDATIGNVEAHCSHAVADWCRLGGGVDPVPRLPDHFVDPNHLTRSLLFEYHGTLRGD